MPGLERRRSSDAREARSPRRALLLCVLPLVLRCADETPSPPPPSPVEPEHLPACGSAGEPCCDAPRVACAPPLSCDDSSNCSPSTGDASTQLCQSDGDCATDEVCCSAGFAGECRARASGACRLPDLALVALGEPRPSLSETYVDAINEPCRIERGCVTGGGWRRIVTLATAIANTGDDLIFGSPLAGRAFERSSCDGEYRVQDFVRHELLDAAGEVVQSSPGYPLCSDSGASRFDCEFMGIESGRVEKRSGQDCTGVDITDVPPGDYLLRIGVNPEQRWSESTLDNNIVQLPLTLTSFDPTESCPEQANPLLDNGFGTKDCGWAPVTDEPASCTPYEQLELVCTSCSGVGLVAVRACSGSEPCSYARSLGESWTDSIFEDPELDPPCLSFYLDCPASGSYRLWQQSDGRGARCSPSVRAPVVP
jgi:hypothetical protein